jgi:hypothetical protein
LEKGGKHHEVPVQHKARDYVAEYLEKAGLSQTSRSFKPSARNSLPDGQCRDPKPYRMIRRRALAVDLSLNRF